MADSGIRQTIRACPVSATPGEIAVDVQGPDGGRRLEYRSPDPVWTSPPTTADFIAIALAQYAAAAGHDLHVDGPVTRRQLDRLDEYLQIWSTWRPDLFSRVRVTATEEVDEPATGGAGAVMGFSGGVDAAYALAAHTTGAVGRSSSPVGLGVLVVGWDLRSGDVEAIARARRLAEEALTAYGARTAVVETNWKDLFCPAWFMCFNAGLMAILHTFSGEYATAIHATDHSYRDELRMAPYGSSLAINHLLGRPGFPVVSTGGLHRRLGRIGFLADHPELLWRLRVCYQEGAGGANCGHCEKCVRTQLELRANRLPTDRIFPAAMTADDLWAATVTNPTVLLHYEDVLGSLDADDPWRREVAAWVKRERMADARRRHLPAARIPELETRLAAAEAELAAMQQSRSWRLTGPLRRSADRFRKGRHEA